VKAEGGVPAEGPSSRGWRQREGMRSQLSLQRARAAPEGEEAPAPAPAEASAAAETSQVEEKGAEEEATTGEAAAMPEAVAVVGTEGILRPVLAELFARVQALPAEAKCSVHVSMVEVEMCVPPQPQVPPFPHLPLSCAAC